jgi:hypothetical protein
MPTKKSSTKKQSPAVAPVIPTVAEPSTSSAETTAAPPPVMSTAPPDVTIPAPPAGFVPVNFEDYRGSRPKAAQVTALPDVILELQASEASYETVFGSSVPPAAQLAGDLANASRWTALRVALQAYLLFVRSFEAITWKYGLSEIEKVNAVFKGISATNPAAVSGFPALTRLLDVPKVIADKAAATHVRKAKAAKATTATATAQSTIAAGSATGTASPAPAPTTAPTAPAAANGANGTGGATH